MHLNTSILYLKILNSDEGAAVVVIYVQYREKAKCPLFDCVSRLNVLQYKTKDRFPRAIL